MPTCAGIGQALNQTIADMEGHCRTTVECSQKFHLSDLEVVIADGSSKCMNLITF